MWAFSGHQVIVVDELEQQHHVLDQWQAAVWNWLSLSYSFTRIRRLLASFLAVSQPEAEERLRFLLQQWQAAGLLQIENGPEPVKRGDRG